MAEDSGDQGKKKDPPKIKIGLDEEVENLEKTPAPSDADKAEQKRSTSRIDLSSAEPPPAKGERATPKKGTSRIDVSKAEPAPGKSETSQIGVTPGPGAPPKRSTTRIDLAAAQPPPPKKSTTRIDPAQATPAGDEADFVRGKSQTRRIELSSAIPPGETVADGLKEGIPGEADSEKQHTMPIKPLPTEPDGDLKETTVPDAAKHATQRIILDEGEGTPASPIKSAAELQEAKARTSRIDLPTPPQPTTEGEDVLKRRTTPVGEAGAPVVLPPEGAPKTIKIKRPEMPVTKVMPRQPVPGQASEAEQAKKVATARLDLPPEVTDRPATRPKTIRIKRPDGTSSRKPLTIARAAGAVAGVEEEGGASVLPQGPVLATAGAAEEDGPGALFVVLSTLGLLVIIALLYVLLGQTYALDLPFPTRL